MRELEEEKERAKQAKREAEEIERLTYADVKGKEWMIPSSQIDRTASHHDEVICEELDDDETDSNSVSNTMASNTLSSYTELLIGDGKRPDSPANLRG